MFRYSIYGHTPIRNKTTLIALTDFKDVADYIAENAPKVLDPTGEREITTTIVEQHSYYSYKKEI